MATKDFHVFDLRLITQGFCRMCRFCGRRKQTRSHVRSVAKFVVLDKLSSALLAW